jgi:hypothetical protein
MGDIRRSKTAFSEAAAHDSRHRHLHSVYFIRSARRISHTHSLMAHALQSRFGTAIRGAPTSTKCRDSRWADWVFPLLRVSESSWLATSRNGASISR